MRTSLLLAILVTSFIGCKQKEEKPREVTQYTIEQFYQTEGIAGSAFNSDETKILISSNRSGIFNIYEVTLNDSVKSALTASDKESLFIVDFFTYSIASLFVGSLHGFELSKNAYSKNQFDPFYLFI